MGEACFPTECVMNYIGEYVATRMTSYRSYKSEYFDVLTCWDGEDGDSKDYPYTFDPTKDYGFSVVYCPVLDDICYDSNPWYVITLCTIHKPHKLT